MSLNLKPLPAGLKRKPGVLDQAALVEAIIARMTVIGGVVGRQYQDGQKIVFVTGFAVPGGTVGIRFDVGYGKGRWAFIGGQGPVHVIAAGDIDAGLAIIDDIFAPRTRH